MTRPQQPHPLLCETCTRPNQDDGNKRFKFCPIVKHYVLMLWGEDWIPYSQLAEEIIKVGCASHTSAPAAEAQQPKESALWSFKTETCNGDKFYPLFRGDQQWGYANKKTYAELMVRALNRDVSRQHPAPAPEFVFAKECMGRYDECAEEECECQPHCIMASNNLRIKSRKAREDVLDELYKFVDGIDPDFIIRERITLMKAALRERGRE